MATPRERLNELRALKAQQAQTQVVLQQPVTQQPQINPRQRLEQLRALQQQQPEQSGLPPQPSDFAGAGVIEPARAIVSGAGRAVVGGLAGIFQALNPFAEEGAGAETVREFQEGAFQPTTEAGRQGLEALGGLVQKGIDIANFPISGIAGLIELISGQGLDQAVATIKSTQEKGISTTAGQRVFEETGSPLAATIAEVAPTAVAELIGLKGAVAVTKAAAPTAAAARQAIATTGQVIGEAGREVAPIVEAIFKFQSPTKQRIAKLIQEGSTDVETARFRLAAPGQPAPTQPTKLQEFLNVGGPRVKTDTLAVNAIKQGFDEGVIAAVKGSSQIDKIKMQKMVDIMERGKKNKKFAATNRPSDVAGDTLLERVKVIRNANRSAGKDINRVANSLKGQQVDILDAVTNFGETLDNLGVILVSNNKGGFIPDFKLSQLGPGDRGPIKEVIRQMNIRSEGGIDAFDVHKMKRIIDNNVTFGKVKTGMSGDAERALKSFRNDLDNALDTNFPEYNQANIKYSETISALDAIQDVAGRKMDLSGGNADKALGTLLRRTLSNAQSRIRLIDSIDEIESVANKHGGSSFPRLTGKGLGRDDLLTQVLFVDELDSVFGPVARTSFQGQIDQALKQGVGAATTKAGAVDIALSAAAKVAEKVRGIDESGAFKAIKELLKETK